MICKDEIIYCKSLIEHEQECEEERVLMWIIRQMHMRWNRHRGSGLTFDEVCQSKAKSLRIIKYTVRVQTSGVWSGT